MISKADRSMFLKLANELILQNEFNDFVAEEKRYKFQNKYTSWYNGYTQLRLPFLTKIHSWDVSPANIKALEIETTETEGAVESFDYHLDFNEKSYFKAIYMTIKISAPENFKNIVNNSLKIVLEGEVDTKKSEGTGLEFVGILNYVDFDERREERFQLSRNQRIKRTYRVSTGVNSEQGTIIEIYYRREFTDEDLFQWKFKRNTG